MRARNIKPGFFRNEQLMQVAPLGRLLFAGLWCLADREGRLYDRPRQIKWDILPADACDVDALLTDLARRGFIRRYAVDGIGYIEVVNFLRHQRPHYKETASTLPPPTISPTQIPAQHRLIPDTRYSDTVFSAVDCPDAGCTDAGRSSVGRSSAGRSSADCSDVGCLDAGRSAVDYPDAGCLDAGLSAVGYSSTRCTDDAPSLSHIMSDGNTNHAKGTNLTSINHTVAPVKTSPMPPHATDIPTLAKAIPSDAGYRNAGMTDLRNDAGYRKIGTSDTAGMTAPHATDIPASVGRLLALWHTLSTHHTTADRHYIESALRQGYPEATLSALFHAKHAEYHTTRSKKNLTLANLLGKKLPHHLANLPTHTASAMPTQTAPASPSKTAKHTRRWTEAFFAE